MQAVASVSLGAAPGKVLPSAGSQSPPPRMFGLSFCVSAHPVHWTYLSESGSFSSAGTAPAQALSLPSHNSGAPGKLLGSASLQSVPFTIGEPTDESP